MDDAFDDADDEDFLEKFNPALILVILGLVKLLLMFILIQSKTPTH